MKPIIKFCTISLVVLLLAVTQCYAQEKADTSLYRVETSDGNICMG